MPKTTKTARRPAGIPLTISLKPRPNDGNDLASDIFKAVRNEDLGKESGGAEQNNIAPAASEITEPVPDPPAPADIQKQPMTARTRPSRPKQTAEKSVSSIKTIGLQDPVERLFEKSKARELYDILLKLTLQSENPTDKVRVPRSYLMANTNIKTRITLDQNLKRLEKLGLIKITSIVGEQEGNLYQVFLPESGKL